MCARTGHNVGRIWDGVFINHPSRTCDEQAALWALFRRKSLGANCNSFGNIAISVCTL
jgi:hypothetical protein